jgi:hypothetical protein
MMQYSGCVVTLGQEHPPHKEDGCTRGLRLPWDCDPTKPHPPLSGNKRFNVPESDCFFQCLPLTLRTEFSHILCARLELDRTLWSTMTAAFSSLLWHCRNHLNLSLRRNSALSFPRRFRLVLLPAGKSDPLLWITPNFLSHKY